MYLGDVYKISFKNIYLWVCKNSEKTYSSQNPYQKKIYVERMG